MTTLAGQSVGKYKLLERLGRGGMAEVYKAHHPKLDRIVAVKILHGYLAEGEDFLARFEREARAVANLKHAHIVQIYDCDVDNATYYMVMEFIGGGTLQERMDELKGTGRYMPLGQVLKVTKEIASALDYAHEKGILHRDIKPSNILLNEKDEAFLADFGIARMVSSTKFTSTGALIGTPTYMSPEQGKGQELTDASDIYSLGVILYELLTGQAPFASDTPLALIQKHVSDPLPPPGIIRPALPLAVETVLIKALEKEPGKRYQTAGEFAEELEKALTPESIAELDGGVAKKKAKTTAPPTEKMSEADLRGRGRMPTVAMTKEERAEVAGKQVAEEAVTKPLAQKKKGRREKRVPVVTPSEGEITTKKITSPRRRLKTWQILLGIIAVITALSLTTKAISIMLTPKTTLTPTPTDIPTTLRSIDEMKMVYVPEGNFTMGSNYGSPDEKPAHPVFLDAYWIDQTEVTNAMYGTCVQAGVCDPPDNTNAYTVSYYYGNPEYSDYPVIWVSWEDAVTYCEWAGAHLPTEAEWEKAARGTDGRVFPWGSENPTSDFLNYNFFSGSPAEVGSFPAGASPYGALDLAGNAWEWVADWYDENYYSQSPSENPEGPSSGTSRVLRGGAYDSNPDFSRSSNRSMGTQSTSYVNSGFRCATSESP